MLKNRIPEREFKSFYVFNYYFFPDTNREIKIHMTRTFSTPREGLKLFKMIQKNPYSAFISFEKKIEKIESVRIQDFMIQCITKNQKGAICLFSQKCPKK